MWKKYKVWGIAALVIAIVVGGFYYYKSTTANQNEAKYTTGKVEKGNINTVINATGTINPVKFVDMSTNIAGILDEVLVKENDHVTKGQVIARIDSRQLQASVDDAKANLDNKQADLNRYSILMSEDAVSRQAYDNAMTAYRTAQAQYNKIAANLSDTTITAPMDGTIIGTPLKAGQTISTGVSTQMIIATIADLSNLEIYLTVDETDVGQVKQGAKVEFTVDSHPGKTYTGTVSAIAKGNKGNMGVTSTSVVYYTVKVAIPTEQASDLLPSMTARATIYGEEQKDTLVVPIAAVRTDKSGEYVYVIKDGQPTRVSVKTGITGESKIQILSGLQEGDEIVVSGDITNSSKSPTNVKVGGPGRG